MKFLVIVTVMLLSLTSSFAEDALVKFQNGASEQKSTGRTFSGTSAYPPNVEPGKCYGRVAVSTHSRSRTVRVETHPAYERLEVIPEKFKTVSEKITIIPARRAGDLLEEAEIELTVRPASVRFVVTQATFRTIFERTKLRGAYTAWKRGENSMTIVNFLGGEKIGVKVLEAKHLSTGETLALVRVPAHFKMVERQILGTPASVRRISVPATTRTIRIQKIATRSDSGSQIPAKTVTISKQVLVTPARVRRIAVAASHRNVTFSEPFSGGPLQWREILCKNGMTTDVIRRIQEAL